MKDAMTPIEAFAFRLKHQSQIEAVTSAVIATIICTVLLALVLSPILIPLFALELIFKGVRGTWRWFFPVPEPQADPTFAKVRAQFKKARATRK